MQIQKILSWVLLIGIITSGVFQISSSTTNAQQATTQPTVTCAPSKKEILRDEKVTFVATVKNASSSITYSWKGTNIQSVNADRVTVSYGSLGLKTATTTVVTNGFSIEAGCSVEVKANVQLQTGQQNNLQQQAQQQLQNILGGQQGGQQGGQTGQQGGQSTSNGGNSGGSQQQTGGNQTNQNTQQTQQIGQSPQEKARKEAEAREKARADFEKRQQETQKEMEQKIKECETDASAGEGADSSIKKAQEAKLQETGQQQQMVPVNPIPIVDPIKNIRENIERLTAKDIGLASSQEPPLDQVVACKTDTALEKVFKDSQDFIYKGDSTESGPKFITQYENHFKKIHDEAEEDFLNAILNNSESCTPEEDKNIALSLLNQKKSLLEEKSKDSCPMDNEDKYNLANIDTFMNFSDPSKNLLIRHLQFDEDKNEALTAKTLLNAYETEIALGFKNIKDEKGNIEHPAQVYLSVALNNFHSQTNRLIELDEATEGKMFSDFMGKVGEAGV